MPEFAPPQPPALHDRRPGTRRRRLWWLLLTLPVAALAAALPATALAVASTALQLLEKYKI